VIYINSSHPLCGWSLTPSNKCHFLFPGDRNGAFFDEIIEDPLQLAAGDLPGKVFCLFSIRSLTPQEAAGSALADAGSNVTPSFCLNHAGVPDSGAEEKMAGRLHLVNVSATQSADKDRN
jgi:hypothetical protein